MAAVGALAAVGSLAAGTEPLPIFEAFDGNSIVSVVAFVALWAGGVWVLRAAKESPRRVFSWAVSFGILFAIAELAGLSLLSEAADLSLLRPSAWSALHALGVGYAATMIVAAALIGADLRGSGSEDEGRLFRFVSLIGGGRGGRRWAAIATAAGVIAVARLPYLMVWWPGLIFFDTYRSLSYARGIGPWEAYEPVGHSLLIAGWNALWEGFGWSDQTALAFAAIVQMLSSRNLPRARSIPR